ncbi:MAG TPA: DUF6265 family protein [Pyrinomonadaceae bacterium]|nr:DUF6265 family protein [Pyrinomonadaceae bacterium]
MKNRYLLGSLLIVIIVGGWLSAMSRSSIDSLRPIPAATISDLSWLAGAWQSPPGGRAQIEEIWTPPAAGAMLGMSRTIAGDKMVEFEFLRIEQRGNDLYYVASPAGRCPATDFKLTRLSSQEAVFENPEHDFPKRIIYRKGADGSLTASIDAGEGTKSKSFPYVRAR